MKGVETYIVRALRRSSGRELSDFSLCSKKNKVINGLKLGFLG